MGTVRHIYQERVKGLGQIGVFLQIILKSSTKKCLEAEGWPPLLTKHFGCTNAGMTVRTPQALLVSYQEDCKCIWELQVLARHSEPLKARRPVRICSRTSLIQVHLWYMPYKLQRPYSKQGLLSVCKRLQPLFSSSPGRTIRTVFTHIYLYNPLYLS